MSSSWEIIQPALVEDPVKIRVEIVFKITGSERVYFIHQHVLEPEVLLISTSILLLLLIFRLS